MALIEQELAEKDRIIKEQATAIAELKQEMSQQKKLQNLQYEDLVSQKYDVQELVRTVAAVQLKADVKNSQMLTLCTAFQVSQRPGYIPSWNEVLGMGTQMLEA